MKYNPFQPNQIVAPGMFTGRIDEVTSIEHSLFQAQMGNPQHFLIEGERGIGKPSLLFVISAIASGRVSPINAQPMRFLVLSVDVGSSSSQLEIVRSIAREFKVEVGKIKSATAIAKRTWDFLSNWEILGVRYHKDAAKLDPDDARETLTEQIIAFTADDSTGIDGVFIIIDEADGPPVEAHLGQFVKGFTERLTKRGCSNVTLGLAGLPTLLPKLRASHESSPRVFSVISLEPLELEECKEVVRKGLAESAIKNDFRTDITDSALELLSELSEGYPHFVQQFSYSAFEAAVGNTIDIPDVLEGAYKENGAIAQLGSKYFNEMYYSKISSDDYRRVLDTMAASGDKWITRKAIADASGLKQTTMANALIALKGRNIIISDASRQGYYRLPTKSFAAWINAIKSVEAQKSAALRI